MSTILLPERFGDGLPLKGVHSEHLADRLILPAHLASSAFGGSGAITEIDPDDAAAAGATGLIADAGHQHPWPCAAPVDLTRTDSNTEGSSGDGARADHGHATDQLGWGITGTRFSSTSDSSAYVANDVTDFVIADIVVDSTRLYEVHFHSRITISAATTWSIIFRVDATDTQEIYHAQVVAGSGARHASVSFNWEPTSGTKDLDVRVITGGGTITFGAASTRPRQFYVKDIGPR